MTFIAYMNVIYFVGSLKIAGGQTFGLPNTFGLLEAKGLIFIPIKVRLLLFGKYTYNFCFSFCEFVMTHSQRVLLGDNFDYSLSSSE